MKVPLGLLVLISLFAAFSVAQAEERINAATWRKVKTYDMAQLKNANSLPMRRIVGIRFNYRHPAVRHLKPNWYHGTIWSVGSSTAVKAELDYIDVLVSKADLEGFKRLPTNPDSSAPQVVYGQILRDHSAGFTFMRLLGTRVRKDGRGGALIGW